MYGEDFLPPYSQSEKMREICHSSQALCARALNQCSRSMELQNNSARLLNRSHQAISTIQETAWRWSFVFLYPLF